MGTTKDLLWKVGFALGYAAISLGAVKALDYFLSVPATLLFALTYGGVWVASITQLCRGQSLLYVMWVNLAFASCMAFGVWMTLAS